MTRGIILLAVPYIASFQYWIIDIIQLMHSFEVNFRICQAKNSEHHFRGLTNPDVNRKRMQQLFCYMTLSLFS